MRVGLVKTLWDVFAFWFQAELITVRRLKSDVTFFLLYSESRANT